MKSKSPPLNIESTVEATNKMATSIGPMQGVQATPKPAPKKKEPTEKV